MWPEQSRGWRQRWRGFRDKLGERIVAESVSGVRSEGLVVAPALVRDEARAAVLCHAVASLSDFTHASLRCPRESYRLIDHPSGVVLIGDYTPGVRLSEWWESRDGTPLSTGTVLHVAQTVGLAVAALGEHQTGLYHGTIGLERVLLAADGRVLLVEPGLGPLLAAQPDERSPQEWWSDFGIAVPFWTHIPPFGPATDVCQLGVLVLELLLGRRLGPQEYPDRLALLLGTAEETDLVGDRTPLGAGLFEWLGLTLGLDGRAEPPTIDVVNRGLEELLSDDGGYVALPIAGPVPSGILDAWAWSSTTGVFEEAAPEQRAEPAGDAPRGAPWPWNAPSIRTASSREESTLLSALTLAAGDDDQIISGEEVALSPELDVPVEWKVLSETATDATPEPARPRGRVTARAPKPQPAAMGERSRWPASVRWGLVALAVTLVATASFTLWRSWRDRHVGEQSGTVVIDSQPAGASITIDGLERGKAPMSIVLVPGPHDIVAKSAQGVGRAKVNVEVGGQHAVNVALQFATDPGYIDINTDPSGAEVTLDGARRGKSPISLDEIPPGEHELVVEQGLARLNRRFTLAPAERLTIYVPLAGWVNVRARVPLQILERGRSVGESTAGHVLVSAGRRRLQFINDEFGINTTQDVVVKAGQVADVSVPLPPGVLSVTTDVPAEVWLDGQHVGRSPTGNLSVAVGEHEVLLTNERWGEQRLTVIVGLGAPTRLSIKMEGVSNSRQPVPRAPMRRYGTR